MIDVAGVAADNFVELGERLDLVGDEAAHGGGAFARLVRQLEHAALQLLAGLLQRMLHLARDLAQFARGIGEALVHVAEERIDLAGRGLVGRANAGRVDEAPNA